VSNKDLVDGRNLKEKWFWTKFFSFVVLHMEEKRDLIWR
jgi:hypothetical protein